MNWILMDILLIVIFVAIVIATGYLLSKPFTNADSFRETPLPIDDYAGQYQGLLQEIKALEKKCVAEEMSDEICIQLEEKKVQAANLLRLINPTLNSNNANTALRAESDQADSLPEDSAPHRTSHFCPQCGERVISSDKFCAFCGHRLKL